MAVYTEVANGELEAFVADYDIGARSRCKGIAEGVENSNFLLRDRPRPLHPHALREARRPADLPFFLGLMEHLAANGIVCPTPLHRRATARRSRSCAAGRRRSSPSSTACGRAGRRRAIASRSARRWPRLHLAGADFALTAPNDLSVAGWRRLFEAAAARAHEVDARARRRDRGASSRPRGATGRRICRLA